jgi:hypothetical protein
VIILGEKLLKEKTITQEQLDQGLERQRRHGGRLGRNLVELGYIKKQDIKRLFEKDPSAPKSIEDSGLELSFITDLVSKHILFMGEFKLADVVDKVKLPISLVNRVLEVLRREKLVEVKGATTYSADTYTFKITEQGQRRSSELLDLCRYAGPAPVSLEDYQNMIEMQTIKSVVVDEESIGRVFSHLVVNEVLLKRIGPAVTSGQAVFVYGPSGNGKTAIAEAIGGLPVDTVYVPYAINVGGQIISVFDPVNHVPVVSTRPQGEVDQRWVLVRRPVVMVGGELTLRMLDLDFNPISKYYEASLQMKANNGIFIVDDFGRQLIEPRIMLNRWIVPLDRHVDFMTLHTGMQFVIPFDMLVVFATNLNPSELLDEAFLRRIRYKIQIDRPNIDEYREIFKAVCKTNNVEFNQDVFAYLVGECYQKYGMERNSCHPRDLIDHIVVDARYYKKPALVTRESIDMACADYFITT